jgi:hypothetical protein
VRPTTGTDSERELVQQRGSHGGGHLVGRIVARAHQIAALQVGGHVGESERGHQGPQVGHGQAVTAADVDAPEQQDVGGHDELPPPVDRRR